MGQPFIQNVAGGSALLWLSLKAYPNPLPDHNVTAFATIRELKK
jgi:hypothetical protein